MYGKEKVCFLVASKPISLYAFLIHEVCTFKTDRYMLNALFLGSWSLAPWLYMVLVTLGLWLLVLAFCCLARGPWLCMRPCICRALNCIVYSSWSVALGPWLLHVSQLLVLDCMHAGMLVLGSWPCTAFGGLRVEISRFTPCIY